MNKTKKIRIASFMAVLTVVLTFSACDMDIGPTQYVAKTADGLEIKLLRYSPSEDAPANEGKQPIILLPGVATNIEEFLYKTTDLMKDAYADLELPAELPAWAVGDEYIQNDHMLLNNLGHFLYLQGFDPWFANYRGVGRGEYHSDDGIAQSNLDLLGCLDMPAMVEKLTEVTGQKPIIGGHSTGGVAAYVYLLGAYMDTDEVIAGKNAVIPYIPHVKVSAQLAKERNAAVKGFIALDPAMIPPLPGYLEFLYPIINLPINLPLDELMNEFLVKSEWDSTMISEVMAVLFNGISWLGDKYDPFQWLHFWETDNMEPEIMDYFLRYGTANFNLRIFAQYFDWGMHYVMREGFTNGKENRLKSRAYDRTDGDGYLYYEDYMHQITTPTICFLSYYNGLVDNNIVQKELMDSKTKHALDESYILYDVAHADLPAGRQAPAIMFPLLAEWLQNFKTR